MAMKNFPGQIPGANGARPIQGNHSQPVQQGMQFQIPHGINGVNSTTVANMNMQIGPTNMALKLPPGRAMQWNAAAAMGQRQAPNGIDLSSSPPPGANALPLGTANMPMGHLVSIPGRASPANVPRLVGTPGRASPNNPHLSTPNGAQQGHSPNGFIPPSPLQHPSTPSPRMPHHHSPTHPTHPSPGHQHQALVGGPGPEHVA